MGHSVISCDVCKSSVMEGRNGWVCDCGAVNPRYITWEWVKDGTVFEEKVQEDITTPSVKVVDVLTPAEFEKECNELLAQGYTLSSSSSGVVNSEAYDFCNYFHAIFVKQENKV